MKARLKTFYFFVGSLFLLRVHKISQIQDFIEFIKGPGVGKSLPKIYIRFRDLQKITRLMNKESVIEFGSGSSTLFFIFRKNICNKLITIEEDSLYLPKIRRTEIKYQPQILKSKTGNFGGFIGTYFPQSSELIDDATFIYVDGPVSPVLDNFPSVAPNLDTLVDVDLTGKIVVIDCRSLTVALLQRKLANTHYFLPSKSFLIEFPKIKFFLKDNYGIYAKYHFSFENDILTRSNVFLPIDKLDVKLNSVVVS